MIVLTEYFHLCTCSAVSPGTEGGTHLQLCLQTVVFWWHGIIVNEEKIFTLDLTDYHGRRVVNVCIQSVVLRAEVFSGAWMEITLVVCAAAKMPLAL